MPKIDIEGLKTDSHTGYPEPYRQIVLGRVRKRLGNAAGLTQFGVNLTTLKPGAASAQRHWHAAEDEFVYVLAGEVVLCEDGGELVMRPGDAAGFKAGDKDGHRLQNRSAADAELLEIGTRIAEDAGYYSDIDMVAPAGGKPATYTRRDGTPYADLRRRGPDDYNPSA